MALSSSKARCPVSCCRTFLWWAGLVTGGWKQQSTEATMPHSWLDHTFNSSESQSSLRLGVSGSSTERLHVTPKSSVTGRARVDLCLRPDPTTMFLGWFQEIFVYFTANTRLTALLFNFKYFYPVIVVCMSLCERENTVCVYVSLCHVCVCTCMCVCTCVHTAAKPVRVGLFPPLWDSGMGWGHLADMAITFIW